MQATVTAVNDGIIRVIVHGRQEELDLLHFDLAVGDKVHIRRVANNPFLARHVPTVNLRPNMPKV